MAQMIYTDFDELLCSAAYMKLKTNGVFGFNSFSPGSDTKASGQIQFQFPPKVTSDNRRGQWKTDSDLAGDDKSVVVSIGSNREMSITWRYIVDGFRWNIDRITKNIRTIRSYYAIIKDKANNRDNLVVDFKLWAIGGKDPISGRLKSVDIKHGDTIVRDMNDNSESDIAAYPLITDVTVDFRVWTDDIKKESAANSGQTLYAVNGLKPMTPDWY